MTHMKSRVKPHMKLQNIDLLLLLLLLLASCSPSDDYKVVDEQTRKPNLVIFYIDDLGYGDVGSYGASGALTPNIDKLAASGVRFTDAHSSAATCTPS